MHLRVSYGKAADLVADHDQQMTRGGLLVRVDPPPAGLALYAEVDLEIVALFVTPPQVVTMRGQVVQIVPRAGVAVAFAPAALATLVDAARALGAAGPGPAAVHEVAEAPFTVAAVEAEEEDDEPDRPGKPSKAALIHKALYGNKDERAAILRNTNRMLHPYVLRNPGIALDEVLAMAKLSTVSPELLKQISDRKEWAHRPDIALALIRNPKLPVPVAIKLLDHVSPAELRQLAKGTHTHGAIQAAARKKVLGP
jgi:hypothetical protein